MTSLTGKHCIAGVWVDTDSSFQTDNPTTGKQLPTRFFNANEARVNEAVLAAGVAFKRYSNTSVAERAEFIREIARQIEARGEQITEIGLLETALPSARLEMERGRTCNQLNFFADWIEEGSWLDARIDHANPDRAPMPKPDVRVVNQALGPVAVFGASNFPLAFSTAGGDTASALAAGCPVVVKAHDAHPGTAEVMAQAISAAVEICNMPAGTFNQLQGGDHSIGAALVKHPGIKAVGFTGSLAGGRALYDIAVNRAEPIPFFGELGSNNPVFLLPEIMSAQAVSIGESWAQSLTMGVGQLCTNPGVIVTLAGDDSHRFKSSAVEALKKVPSQAMLTERIAQGYRDITTANNGNTRLTCLLAPQDQDHAFSATPAVYACDAQVWLDEQDLREEIFGPGAIVVECQSIAEMERVAASLCGQLTATVHMNDEDTELAARLISVLGEKSGRVLVNGFPTGVEVCHAMVHGGPYPASTAVQTTSVGSLAIRRFVKPVAYQNVPDAILPAALQEANPMGIARLVDGTYQD